ncbi:MAG: hypothetical protein ACYCZ6_17250, partial [Polaromonas sp.]
SADADIAALKKASKTLDQLLAAQGVDVEEVVAEFKAVRKQASPRTCRSSRTAACPLRTVMIEIPLSAMQRNESFASARCRAVQLHDFGDRSAAVHRLRLRAHS